MSFVIDDLTSVVAHWNASDITGVSDGAAVATLPDSISGWDMAAAGSSQPLYRATSAMNSMAALEFDGIDDWMQTASKTLAGPAHPAWAIAFRYDVLKNYNPLLHVNTLSGVPTYSNTANLRIEGQGYADGNILQAASDGSSRGYSLGSAAMTSAATTYILTSVMGEASHLVNLNGSNVIASTVAPVPSALDTALFASIARSTLGAFDGLVAEIVIWDETELSERVWIEGVLAHRYGVTLPTWHPFQAAAPTTAPGSTTEITAVFHPLSEG